jgi:hypothetical protein
VGGVEAPADPARAHPLLQPRDVLVVEPEAAADRLAVGEVEHLGRGEALVGQLDEACDDAEDRVRLPQRAVGQADAQVGELARPLLLADRTERGLQQGGERLDVGAHHDDVARLERRVLGQQVQDRVAQDLDLARAAVAGVDLDAVVRLCVLERSILPDAGLEACEQGVATDVHGMSLLAVLRARQHELKLARVAPPRREQGIARQARSLVVAPANHRGMGPHLLPQRGRGMQDVDVDVASGGERLQDVEVPGRQPGQPEDAEPIGQLRERRLRAQPGARVLDPLGRPRDADPFAGAPPQLRLPGRIGRHAGVVAARPRPHHLGAVQRVAGEQVREVTQAGEPPPLLERAFEVLLERAQPGLVEAVVDDGEQRPDASLRHPRVAVGVDP